jgi:hypothetical protein
MPPVGDVLICPNCGRHPQSSRDGGWSRLYFRRDWQRNVGEHQDGDVHRRYQRGDPHQGQSRRRAGAPRANHKVSTTVEN